MNVSRVGVRALQQGAKPNVFFSQNLPRLALSAKATSTIQTRPASTNKITETDAHSILAAQRRQRPISPHLQVYDPSQTWFGGSIWNRITGGIFSGGLYVFATAYLAAPLLGWHIESASMAAAFGTLPLAVKGSLKFLLAWPFAFHGINSCRHLTWDTAKGFSKKSVMSGGYAILGASVVSAFGIAFFM
ncbi:succinate dehydrogenase cytochrome b subunit [Apiospora arundinis]|uniref:Succinate dehydrogenase cytochrome b subunit n=1 Tax=Apiospora arundinis TaxID=335852 RepID=A0ABR2I210_9PEZI